nr:helix-turn-helix transcriptional regulator [Clostridium paraputrificum]
MSNEYIGENIKVLRVKKKWKRSYVSNKTGIEEDRYNLIENSKRVPTWEELFKISRLYGMTIDDLMFKKIKSKSVHRGRFFLEKAMEYKGEISIFS